MPFTPYHLGPALLIGLILYPLIDIPTFLIANIVLDFEPLMVILTNSELDLHGRFHSLTLGTVIGLILALLVITFRKYSKTIIIETKLDHSSTIQKTIISSVIGVWLHVLLDSFIYTDLNLFFPLEWNPLQGLFLLGNIQKFCLISFPLAVMVYLIRITSIWLKEKKENEDLSVTQHSKQDETFYNFNEQVLSQEKDTIYFNPQIIEETEQFYQEPIALPPPSDIAESSKTPIVTRSSENIPEIYIGIDKPPIQWGIIGKSDHTAVGVDLNEPHIVFVSGKQGSGKGYTIGVLSEMLLKTSIPNISNVQKPATIILFHKPREDMRSEFWSIIHTNQNKKETEILEEEYNVMPQHVINASKLRIFLDPFVYLNERRKFEKEYGTRVFPIGISPNGLTAEDWPYVLSIGKKSGSMYVKKIFQIIKKTQYEKNFGLNMIRKHIDASDLNLNQKSFASMRLETLQEYLEAGDFIQDLAMGGVNIFDLRKIMMEPDDVFSVMILVISAILNDENTEREQFVFVINEAHDYLRKGLSKDFTDYISYLVRKKRHAGTWLMLDTHFPEDVDPKIIKGSDIKIFHKSDIISSSLLNQIVEGTPIPPHELNTGQAIIRSDKSNLGSDKLLIVNIRPRLTHHGGATKTAI
jgi:membrane-bound metal-dependent hydrolase YbcI (DUF457 family)